MTTEIEFIFKTHGGEGFNYLDVAGRITDKVDEARRFANRKEAKDFALAHGRNTGYIMPVRRARHAGEVVVLETATNSYGVP